MTININIPNVPNLVGKVAHIPVDVFKGVKDGFTGMDELQRKAIADSKSK